MKVIYERKKQEFQNQISLNIKERQEELLTFKKNFGNFSKYLVDFLNNYALKLKEAEGGEYFNVSAVLGGIARVYEKIRNIVEYKGEHVLRRNAIERILKRLIWEKENVGNNIDVGKVSQSLIKELIWARYLPNNKLPLRKLEEVEVVIEKYLYLLKNIEEIPEGLSIYKVQNWIWGVASSEIEDILEPSFRELYVNLMLYWFLDHFEWVDADIEESQKKIQIYIAIHRSFVKSDDPIIRYHLLLKQFPGWNKGNFDDVKEFVSNFANIYFEIERQLNFPGSLVLYRKINRFSAAFEVFKEIVSKNFKDLGKILTDRNRFEETVRNICTDKYKLLKQRVNTAILRSVLYIFITKVFFALLIEIPYEIFIYGDVRYLPLSINIVFPPFMMFLIGVSIKVPGEENTKEIVKMLHSLIYETKDKEKIKFSIFNRNKNPTLDYIFGVFYLGLFVLVFGGISWLLIKLNYSLFGVLVFFIFISLVILFAFRVRFNALRLKVKSEEEGFISHILGYVTLPFLNFGMYLSKNLSKLNFFTIFLDFLIEIPLKNIIEVFDEWGRFLREKKEEVVEIPE